MIKDQNSSKIIEKVNTKDIELNIKYLNIHH